MLILIRNSRGLSIVEVLVSLGIMAFVTMGMMTLMSNQTKDIRSIDEKMSLQGVATQITNVMTSQEFCACFIGANTFNYTTTTWNGFPTSIASSYNGTCAGVGVPLLTVGSNIGSSSLRPISMALQNITETTVGSGNFSADLVLPFDSSLLVRARNPISIPMYFSVNMADPVAARTLMACGSSGAGGAGWSTTGNSGTDATNFLGTVDDVDVHFRRNNILAGRLGSVSGLSEGNTSFGVASLPLTSTGLRNSAFGVRALFSNTTGHANSAFGVDALASNTAGVGNQAIGRRALTLNTTGSSNIAIGLDALASNTAGSYNVVMGFSGHQANTIGNSNTAIGNMAMFNGGNTQSGTTAIGAAAGANAYGDGNVFLGLLSGPGPDGMGLPTPVSNKLYISNTAGTPLIFGDFAAGRVAIGMTAPTFQFQLSADSAAKPGTSAWTIASDSRLKNVRAPFDRGLDAIEQLNPIYFNYKKGNPLGLPSSKEYVGILAQDAQRAIPESIRTDDKGFLHLTNDAVIWTLLNATKELHQQSLAKDKEIAELRAEIHSIHVMLETLRQAKDRSPLTK